MRMTYWSTLNSWTTATGKKFNAALAVDLPGLVTFRQGFLDLLDRAGIPVPEAQRAKMLWREELTAQQFILLGNMLYEYLPTSTWPRQEPGEHPELLDPAGLFSSLLPFAEHLGMD